MKEAVLQEYVGDLPDQLAALNTTNILVHQQMAKAMVERRYEYIYEGVKLDPMTAAICTLSEINSMVDELIEANKKYIDESGKWRVHIQDHAKTDAGYRDIILPPQAKETIKAIRRINPFGEFLFMNQGRRVRGTNVANRLTTVCDKLGLSRRSSHKIRKTYGTTLLDAKVDDALVAKQMGHKDVATTRKLYYFCNASEDSKRQQVAQAITYG